jgi:hypothetical protein
MPGVMTPAGLSTQNVFGPSKRTFSAHLVRLKASTQVWDMEQVNPECKLQLVLMNLHATILALGPRHCSMAVLRAITTLLR